jgi:hypothetical protein
MQERQADQVESRVTFHQTTPVPRLAVLVEDRKIDPIEAGMKPAAPDDIGDGKRSTVLEKRLAVAHANHTWHALDARRC